MLTLNYDDNAFGFFAIAVLAVFSFSSTVYILRTILTWKEEKLEIRPGRTPAEEAKLQQILAKRQKKQLWTNGFIALAVFNILAIVLLVVLIFTVGIDSKLATYDPYQILGLEVGATEREIKSAYRTLSRVHHPDRGGSADVFQKIAKAYETLLDPEARANWEATGNPDKNAPMELGIGIPSFIIVNPFGRYGFFLSYIVLIIGVIPYVLYRLYKSTQGKNTVFQLSNDSLSYLYTRAFQFRFEERSRSMLETYAVIPEHKDITFTPLQQEELLTHLHTLQDPKKPRIFFTVGTKVDKEGRPIPNSQFDTVPFPARFKVILLYAYINRIEFRDPELYTKAEQLTRYLNSAVKFNVKLGEEQQHKTQIESGIPGNKSNDARVRWLDLSVAGLRMSASIIQRLPQQESSFLQIFTDEEAKRVGNKKRNRELGDLLRNTAPQELDALFTETIGPKSLPRRTELDRILQELPLLDVTFKVGVLKNPQSDEVDPRVFVGDVVTIVTEIRHRGLKDEDAVPPVYAPHYGKELIEEWHMFYLDNHNKLFPIGEDMQGPDNNHQFPVYRDFYQYFTTTKGCTVIKTQFRANLAKKYSLKALLLSPYYMGLDVETPLYSFEIHSEEEKEKYKAAKRAAELEAEANNTDDNGTKVYRSLAHLGIPDDDGYDSDEEEEEPKQKIESIEKQLLGGRQFTKDYDDLSDYEQEDYQADHADTTNGESSNIGTNNSNSGSNSSNPVLKGTNPSTSFSKTEEEEDDDWKVGIFNRAAKAKKNQTSNKTK